MWSAIFEVISCVSQHIQIRQKAVFVVDCLEEAYDGEFYGSIHPYIESKQNLLYMYG